MVDQLINYKTAELAKEKGFNESTYSNCWIKTLDGDILHNSDSQDCVEHDRCETYMMQPTQTHLQKWLRDKFNIHICVCAYCEGYSFEISSTPKTFMDDLFSKRNRYETYEKALNEGLLEALKLI